MTDQAPLSSEPRTEAGRELIRLFSWRVGGRETKTWDELRDGILAIEREAAPSGDGLDVERLAKAMALVHVTDHPIKEALEHWESYRTDATELAAAYGAVGDLPDYTRLRDIEASR